MTDGHEYKAEEISHYVELETQDEVVTLAERVLVESVISRRHEVWNVHTDKSRYWVITDLTNLYDQDEFPSYHMAFNCHLGLMLRMHERQFRDGSRAEEDQAERAWRRFSNAADALADAREAEDFQAIGMRCREVLLTLSGELRDRGIFVPQTSGLQDANFVEWAREACGSMLPGKSNERVRRHLRDLCINAWNAAAWLTHYRHANYFHGNYVLEATSFVLTSMSTVSLRHRLEPPEVCPECGSYQVEAFWLSRSMPDSPGLVACAACDWQRER